MTDFTTEPLVSVVIAAYNRPLYLQEAIESVLLGSYSNFEIIVSDDCGPGSLRAVTESFGDSRIRYRRNAITLGIAGNHIAAFQEIRGKYFTVLNDDDIWEKNYLAILIPPLEADPDLVLAFSDHHIIDENGTIDHAITEANTRLWKRHSLTPGVHRPFCHIGLVQQSIPTVMAAVIRASAIDWDDMPVAIGSSYDIWLTYLACRTGRSAYYIPQRLTRYRSHGQSETSTNRIRICQSNIYCYQRFLQDSRLLQFRRHFRFKLGFAHTSLGISLMRLGRTAEARPHLWNGLFYNPSLRSAGAFFLSMPPRPWKNWK